MLLRFISVVTFVISSALVQADILIGATGGSGSGTREFTYSNGTVTKQDLNVSTAAFKVGFAGSNSRTEFSAITGDAEGFGFDWYVTFGQRAVKPYLVAGGAFVSADFDGAKDVFGFNYGLGAGLFWQVAGPLELEAGYRWSGTTWETIRLANGSSVDVVDKASMGYAGVRLRF